MFRNGMWVFAAALLLALGACTKQDAPVAPREVLSKYVSSAFGVKAVSDLAELKQYATGQALAELNGLEKDTELFNRTFVEQNIQSASSLKIRDERKVDEARYSITYELAYRDSKKDTGDNTVTIKKHAMFAKQDGKWLISEVQNLKTVVEHTTDENIQANPPAGDAKKQ